MEIKYLKEGLRPSLLELLDRREEREVFVCDLEKTYKGKLILVFTLNIPGPVKNNQKIEDLFRLGERLIDQRPRDFGLEITYKKEYLLPTGPEAYFVVDGEAKKLKRQMTQVEDSDLGRLFDIDVRESGKFLSRKDLGLKERKCFLCQKPAKVCARSRAHSVDQMLRYIEKLMDKYL